MIRSICVGCSPVKTLDHFFFFAFQRRKKKTNDIVFKSGVRSCVSEWRLMVGAFRLDQTENFIFRQCDDENRMYGTSKIASKKKKFKINGTCGVWVFLHSSDKDLVSSTIDWFNCSKKKERKKQTNKLTWIPISFDISSAIYLYNILSNIYFLSIL